MTDRKIKLTPLTQEIIHTRLPLVNPVDLMNALQDPIHEDIKRSRLVKIVKR